MPIHRVEPSAVQPSVTTPEEDMSTRRAPKATSRDHYLPVSEVAEDVSTRRGSRPTFRGVLPDSPGVREDEEEHSSRRGSKPTFRGHDKSFDVPQKAPAQIAKKSQQWRWSTRACWTWWLVWLNGNRKGPRTTAVRHR